VRGVGHVARVGCQKCKKILKAGDKLGDLGKDGYNINVDIWVGFWIRDGGKLL
jgi:hypothetical protein